MRYGLLAVGLTDQALAPLLLTISLLAWQAVDRRDWRFRPHVLGGMVVESALLAVVLMGCSKLVDAGFHHLDEPGAGASTLAAGSRTGPWLAFIGAGIYEEFFFRLAMIPLLYRGLRLLAMPGLPACTLAITASALLFSLAHHAGAPGEVYSLFAFVFRWLAGVFFAYVFVARGFGIAVGTHSAYDLLVGWGEI